MSDIQKVSSDKSDSDSTPGDADPAQTKKYVLRGPAIMNKICLVQVCNGDRACWKGLYKKDLKLTKHGPVSKDKSQMATDREKAKDAKSNPPKIVNTSVKKPNSGQFKAKESGGDTTANSSRSPSASSKGRVTEPAGPTLDAETTTQRGAASKTVLTNIV